MAYTESYNTDPVVGFVGMIANLEEAEVISRSLESASVGFGLPVKQGTADKQVAVVGSGTTEVVGFTVRDQATAADNSVDKYEQYDDVPLMREGVLWVTVVDAGGVVAGDPVWVTLATGTLSNADVGSSGGLKLPGCRWETSAANGALAKLRVNLDVPAVAGAA